MNEIDLVEILFTLFWIFFLVLVLYLHRESKREGYPLDSDRTNRSGGMVQVHGFPMTPPPKTFKLENGETVTVPRPVNERKLALRPAGRYPGAPGEPTGNPMLDGVGPASYSDRDDVPDHTIHGEDRIVPMRVATDFKVNPGIDLIGTGQRSGTDPMGFPVYGADDELAGKVVDIWVDRCEPMVVFFEVAVEGTENHTALLPFTFSRVKGDRINVASINANQFAQVPALGNPDRITRLEEDKIMGYFGGGTLYANDTRQEPLL
ncbi:MAG: photosynthetic reaction center subunit H [Pseudomonadota bacterium]